MALYPKVLDATTGEALEFVMEVDHDETSFITITVQDQKEGDDRATYYIDSVEEADTMIKDLQEQREILMESIKQYRK